MVNITTTTRVVYSAHTAFVMLPTSVQYYLLLHLLIKKQVPSNVVSCYVEGSISFHSTGVY
jgi:hypothetical protein